MNNGTPPSSAISSNPPLSIGFGQTNGINPGASPVKYKSRLLNGFDNSGSQVKGRVCNQIFQAYSRSRSTQAGR